MNNLPADLVQFGMPAQSNRHRVGQAVLLAVAIVLLGAAALYGPVIAFHVLPLSVTGEDARLAALLQVVPGQAIAEIGAGSGALSIALARRIAPGGILYSTELDPDRRRQIRARAERARAANVVVVEAGEAATGLPDGCCDAIFMRNVYHHIGDTAPFNRSLIRAIRPGGRLAVIDFTPGAFWHLRQRPDGAAGKRTGHGVGPLAVVEELEEAGFRRERIALDWGGRLFLVLMRAPGSGTGRRPDQRATGPALAD